MRLLRAFWQSIIDVIGTGVFDFSDLLTSEDKPCYTSPNTPPRSEP